MITRIFVSLSLIISFQTYAGPFDDLQKGLGAIKDLEGMMDKKEEKKDEKNIEQAKEPVIANEPVIEDPAVAEAKRKEAEKILRDYIGFTSKAITVDSQVMGLSGGEKQGVAFGRSLYFNSDLIVLDEPTMGLSIQETEKVLNFVKGLKNENKSAIFIDHNIIHVYGAADRFIILDRGEVVGEFNKEDISREELVQKMIQLHESGKIKVED